MATYQCPTVGYLPSTYSDSYSESSSVVPLDQRSKVFQRFVLTLKGLCPVYSRYLAFFDPSCLGMLAGLALALLGLACLEAEPGELVGIAMYLDGPKSFAIGSSSSTSCSYLNLWGCC